MMRRTMASPNSHSAGAAGWSPVDFGGGERLKDAGHEGRIDPDSRYPKF